ncbi:MAG: hypothetical protein ACFFEW_16710 [Candidatus Thorarchaeota archaeon]
MLFFQYRRAIVGKFQSLIKIIQLDLTQGSSGIGLEGLYIGMWDADINILFEKIRDKFGLLTIDPWWHLVFRTDDGRGAAIFVDLLKNNTATYATMTFFELFRYIMSSPRWREAITATPGPDNGMGPWVPEDV